MMGIISYCSMDDLEGPNESIENSCLSINLKGSIAGTVSFCKGFL